MQKYFIFIFYVLCSSILAANPNDLKKLPTKDSLTPTATLDLSNTDLRNYLFIPGKINLEGARFTHSNLSHVNLEKMNLSHADLSYADLSNASLRNTNLSGANLSHANLSYAELEGANLSQANLLCANLTNANLTKANVEHTVISGALFINTITTDVMNYVSVIESQVNC